MTDLTRAQLVNRVKSLVGRTDSTVENRIKDALESRQREVARMHKWPEFLETGTFTATSGRDQFGLPQRLDVLHRVWNTGSVFSFSPLSEEEMVSRNVATLGTTGTPRFFSRLGNFPVKFFPSTATAISFHNTIGLALSDVLVKGLDSSGEYQTETVSMGSGGTVSTAAAYSKVHSLSRLTTTQPIDVIIDGEVVGRIASGHSNSGYPWIRFDRTFSSDTVVGISFSRYPNDMSADNDTPELVDSGDMLAQGAYADVLRSLHQHQKAGIEENKFLLMLNDYMGHRSSDDSDWSTNPDINFLAQRQSFDHRHNVWWNNA